MAQIKDFISSCCAETQLSKEFVTTVTNYFVDWIHDSMLMGENLRLPGIGTFKISPNSYSQSGLMKNGASLHYHEFRPSFRFCVPFRQECDQKADQIRKGIEKREVKKKGQPLTPTISPEGARE